MKISFVVDKKGITAELLGDKYRLVYPAEIWKGFRQKEIFLDNTAYLLTVNMPMVSNFRALEYNTSLPLFKPFFDKLILGGIPGAVDAYRANTKKTIKKFLSTRYSFKNSRIKMPEKARIKTNNRAVVGFSCGKDSLLSLGVCNELGLDPVMTYINDTVSPGENTLKLRFTRRIARKFGLDHVIVRNEMEKLNDFETWGTPETCLGYSHMLASFCLISLPIAQHFSANSIVLGCEQEFNHRFKNKDGIMTYPSFDQTSESVKGHSAMIQCLSNNKIGVSSVIEPLCDMAILKILYHRYPELAKFQVTCGELDASKEPRWCHECYDCTDTFITLMALGINPKKVGFHKNLLKKKYKKYYLIFGGKKLPRHCITKDERDGELLFLYLAHKSGFRGYLIDLFRKKFLEETKKREDELLKKELKITEPVTMPAKLKRQVMSIYKEELNR